MVDRRAIRRWISVALLALAPAAHAAVVARPGTINFIEGKAMLDGKAAVADGTDAALLGTRTLETEKGRVEILLTPGVFLRVAENSAVRLGDAGPGQVRVELLKGEILVEAGALDRRHAIDVAGAHLTRPGIYEFDASSGAAAHALKPAANGDADPLYRWSLDRAAQDAWVAEWTAYNLLALGPDGTRYAEGWYWNPWLGAWAWIPASGHGRVTPFHFGYYAPDAMHSQAPVFADFR